jgi:hypothetical protein
VEVIIKGGFIKNNHLLGNLLWIHNNLQKKS